MTHQELEKKPNITQAQKPTITHGVAQRPRALRAMS